MGEKTKLLVAFIYCISGIIGGFCSSTPIGPINLWVVNLTIKNRDREVAPYITGVISCDILYAALAAWGYYEWFNSSLFQQIVSYVGGIFLIILGIIGLKYRFKQRFQQTTAKDSGHPQAPSENVGQKARQSHTKSLVIKNPVRSFFLGFVMTGTNPAFLLFWVTAISLVSTKIGEEITSIQSIVFLCGILIGDCIWFKSLHIVAKKAQERLKTQWIDNFRLFIALFFIILGIAAIAQIL